ncbi:MAG: hypothetical protein AB1586_21470 [Pseudomonadota bacterium]|jgi:hypothetical protein
MSRALGIPAADLIFRAMVALALVGHVIFSNQAARALGRLPETQLGPDLMRAANSPPIHPAGDCKERLRGLVKDLDFVLASDPQSVAAVYEVFYKYFPINRCAIEDVLLIARSSRFFTGSEDVPGYYNVAFNSTGVSSRPGFAALLSLSKKTGNMEMPFAKVNGY